jgi:hypothetical protein
MKEKIESKVGGRKHGKAKKTYLPRPYAVDTSGVVMTTRELQEAREGRNS